VGQSLQQIWDETGTQQMGHMTVLENPDHH
jgi:hypothetical protein